MARNHAPNARDAEVIANAEAYSVCGFRGRGQFEQERHTQLPSAREAARAMANRLRRPVAIYALMAAVPMERQAHLENVEPS